MQRIIFSSVFIWFSCFPGSVYAYLGPGLAVSTIGAVVGVLGVAVIALSAIIWYPLKTMLRKIVKIKRHKAETNDNSE